MGRPRSFTARIGRSFRSLSNSRREHVSFVSAQVRRQVQAGTVGKTDELHNLNTATRAGAEASDTLKYFTERIPATFLYAGISLDRAGLLSGTRGEQIAGRFGIIRTGPFGQDQQWTALIAAVEDSLRLHRHRPGTLPGLGRYLHRRSHGMIGSLLWLIRSAAISAVLDGTEKITRKALDNAEADITSQSSHPPVT